MPRVHYCFSQHLNETLPPTKCSGVCKKNKKRCICIRCKCRKEVSPKIANELVSLGVAEYLVLRREPIEVKDVCPLCANNDSLKKSCANCNKTGEITQIKLAPVYSNDIVMVTVGSGDTESDPKIYRPVMSLKTPRVMTIEKANIERALDNPKERERIEIFQQMIMEARAAWIVPFRPDPWEGRAIYSFGVDNRSVSSNWEYESI